MTMEELIVQSDDFQTIQNQIKMNKVAKSLLLISKDSDYAFEFASLCAVALLLDGAIKHDESYFKIKSGNHPDVKIFPLKDKLLVSDSEQIVEESFIKPIFANKKIFIIKNIDNSMDSAQNKLLKILEEPPSGVFFILLCENLNLVLPTIRSRCQKHELKKFAPAQVDQFLKSDKDNIIKYICDGYIGKALKLEKLKDLDTIYELSVALLTKLVSSKQVLSYSKQILAHKDNLALILEILALALEDLLLIKAGKSQMTRLVDKREELQEKSSEYTARAICEIQRLLDEARKHLVYNTNVTLVVENLLLDILEVKYICK